MALCFVHSGSISQAQDSRHQAPESRTQTPDSRLQAPAPRLQTPDFRHEAPESRLQTPDSRLQAPDPRLQIPGSCSMAVLVAVWVQETKTKPSRPGATGQAHSWPGRRPRPARPGQFRQNDRAPPLHCRYTATTPLRHQSVPRNLERAARVAFLGESGGSPSAQSLGTGPLSRSEAHSPGQHVRIPLFWLLPPRRRCGNAAATPL